METDKRVQILLSTYNGARYLREQLDSYIAMDGFSQAKVLIRDDGSTDDTAVILEEYKEKYGFEVLYGENVGVNKSIFLLLEAADKSCDYYALSDQDDVWLSDKLMRSLKCIDKVNDLDKPVLYASATQVSSEKLEPLALSTLSKKGVCFLNAMTQNIMPGHTQLLNRSLAEMVLSHGYDENIFVVDWWFYLVASAFGTVCFENTPTVLHRQHGDNAVGYEVNWFRHTLGRLRRARGAGKNKCALQLYAFQKQYGKELIPQYADEVNSYLSDLDHFGSRLRFIFHTKAFMQSQPDTLMFKLLYLSGKYKINKQ